MAIGVVLCLASLSVFVAALALANTDRLNEKRAERRETLSSDPVGQATESSDDAEIELVTLGEEATESAKQQTHAPEPEARGRTSPQEGDEAKADDANPPPPASSLPWSLVMGKGALCGGSDSGEDDTTVTSTV